MSIAAEAERLSRRRARMMPLLALILITQQGAFAIAAESPRRSVDYVTLGAWLLLAAVILAALVTGGFWLKPRPVRALMDDEVTKANRASALSLGFVLSTVTAMVLYVVNFAEPVPAAIAIHVIVTCGLAGAMFRFAVLERRALA
jgi:hypothetical protein